LRAIEALQEQAGGVPTLNVEGIVDGEVVGGIQLQFLGPVSLPKLYLPLVRK
jgi:hypothetical protein